MRAGEAGDTKIAAHVGAEHPRIAHGDRGAAAAHRHLVGERDRSTGAEDVLVLEAEGELRAGPEPRGGAHGPRVLAADDERDGALRAAPAGGDDDVGEEPLPPE